MRIRELIAQVARGEGLPNDFETYMEEELPKVLVNSTTLQQAFGINDEEMAFFYDEGCKAYENDWLKSAKDTFKILALLNPFVDQYWLALGASEQCLGLYEQALKRYALAAVLDEKNPTPHHRAHDIYVALGKVQEAKKAQALAHQLEKEVLCQQ